MGVGRGPGLGGRDDFHEFRVGRIKHERVKVSKIQVVLLIGLKHDVPFCTTTNIDRM